MNKKGKAFFSQFTRALYLWIFAVVLIHISLKTIYALEYRASLSDYSRQTWTFYDGLPQNSIYCIIQTSDGYIWIGTEIGLVKFDGFNFTLINADPDGNNIRMVRNIIEDKDGSLWLDTRGKDLVRYKDGYFYYIPLNAGRSSIVRSIGKTNKGSLLVGTDEYGIGIVSDFKIKYFSNIEPIKKCDILSILEDSNDNIWIGTYGKGLYKYDNGNLTHYTTENGLVNNSILILFETKDHGILIGTSNGLSYLKDGRFETYKIETGLSHDIVNSVLEDRNGNVWIGTSDGLTRLKNGKLDRFHESDGLSGRVIFKLFEDREGALWIGTSDSGLQRFSKSLFVNYSQKDGIQNNIALGLHEDNDKNIWFGTWGNGLVLMKNDKFKIFTKRNKLIGDYVYCVYMDSKDRLWIGCNGGISVMKNGNVTNYRLEGNFVNAITEDKAGRILCGTYHGLIIFDKGKITTFSKEQGLSHNYITAAQVGRDGSIWLGTNGGGLNKLKDGRLDIYTTENGLSNDFIRSLYIDRDDVLWIGTQYGLNRLKNGKFTVFTQEDGMFSNIIYSCVEDSYGNMWFSSNSGIFKAVKKDLNDFANDLKQSVNTIGYTEADGMHSRDCVGGMQSTGIKASNGLLYFSTAKGIVVADPADFTHSEPQLPVIVEEMIVDNKKLYKKSELNIPRGSKNIEIHYTALCYSGSEKIKFKYKLHGFDQDWIDAGNRRIAYYTNLPPGDYRFEVAAKNKAGVWTQKSAILKFDLPPFFYQTIYFYLLAIFSFVTVVIGTSVLRIRQMHKKRIELELLVEERTKQLKKANVTLEKLVNIDGLTQVYNRRYFMRIFNNEWKRAIREKASISLIMGDIDFFKPYNDAYGHQAGDRCLKKVAKTIQDSIKRSSDFVARYGGEEFVIILPLTNLGGALSVAEHIRLNIENLHITHSASKVSKFVTISLGVSSIKPGINLQSKSLLDAADRALYSAKKKGRNRVEVKE